MLVGYCHAAANCTSDDDCRIASEYITCSGLVYGWRGAQCLRLEEQYRCDFNQNQCFGVNEISQCLQQQPAAAALAECPDEACIMPTACQPLTDVLTSNDPTKVSDFVDETNKRFLRTILDLFYRWSDSW